MWRGREEGREPRWRRPARGLRVVESFDDGGYMTWKGAAIVGPGSSAAACCGAVDIVGLGVSVRWGGVEEGHEEALSIVFST